MHSHQRFRDSGRNRVSAILASSNGREKPVAKRFGGAIGSAGMKHAAPDERDDMSTEGKARGKRWINAASLIAELDESRRLAIVTFALSRSCAG